MGHLFLMCLSSEFVCACVCHCVQVKVKNFNLCKWVSSFYYVSSRDQHTQVFSLEVPWPAKPSPVLSESSQAKGTNLGRADGHSPVGLAFSCFSLLLWLLLLKALPALVLVLLVHNTFFLITRFVVTFQPFCSGFSWNTVLLASGCYPASLSTNSAAAPKWLYLPRLGDSDKWARRYSLPQYLLLPVLVLLPTSLYSLFSRLSVRLRSTRDQHAGDAPYSAQSPAYFRRNRAVVHAHGLRTDGEVYAEPHLVPKAISPFLEKSLLCFLEQGPSIWKLGCPLHITGLQQVVQVILDHQRPCMCL